MYLRIPHKYLSLVYIYSKTISPSIKSSSFSFFFFSTLFNENKNREKKCIVEVTAGSHQGYKRQGQPIDFHVNDSSMNKQ